MPAVPGDLACHRGLFVTWVSVLRSSGSGRALSRQQLCLSLCSTPLFTGVPFIKVTFAQAVARCGVWVHLPKWIEVSD